MSAKDAIASAFSVRAASASALKKALEKSTSNTGSLWDLRTVNMKEGDKTVEYYPFVFSKTLPHHPTTGFVKKDDADKLIDAIKDGSVGNRAEVIQHPNNTRRLVSVNDGLSHTLMGGDPRLQNIDDTFLPVSSKSNMFEMMEVYENALLRDTSFDTMQTGTDVNVMRAIATMNAYGNACTAPTKDNNVTGSTLFRGNAKDECVGPYVSQFLVKPYNYGNQTIEQKYQPENDPITPVTMTGWFDIQNGIIGSNPNKTEAIYNYNPRVLGAKVHNDPLYQFYYAAALISLQNGISPDGFQNADSKFEAFAVTGPPDILAATATVAGLALRSAFNVKWGHALKIRPEVMAQRLDRIDAGAYDDLNFPDLEVFKMNMEYGRNTLTAVANDNKALNADASGILLKLQFQEGSPVHPAWPAGHAAVAGACTTVLKAMLKTHDANGARIKWVNDSRKLEHSVDGISLVEYTRDDAMDCTVIGEFNKLASNVSIGRDFAGVHYRCDGDCGMALGEKVAIDFLVDKARETYESYEGIFKGWTLEKFDGTTVKITKDGVEER